MIGPRPAGKSAQGLPQPPSLPGPGAGAGASALLGTTARPAMQRALRCQGCTHSPLLTVLLVRDIMHRLPIMAAPPPFPVM
jgi:hypothetical protein